MSKIEMRKVSLEFRTLSSQMLKLDSESEFNFIEIFYDYISKTPVLKNYIDSCLIKEYNIDAIIREMNGWGALPLPSNTREIISYVYQILSFLVANPNRLMGLCLYYTTSNSYADKLQAFMRKTVEPFVIALRSYLELELITNDDGQEIYKKDNGKTLFLSYCQYDSCIADLVETAIVSRLGENIKISRDIRDVKYKQSFRRFMETIGNHDFAAMVVSDKYLKSRNCMYEVLEVLKDKNYTDKLLFIVLSDSDSQYYKKTPSEKIGADVYNSIGQLTYISYWKIFAEQLQSEIAQIGDPTFSIEQIKELNIVRKIQLDLSEFLGYLKDSNGIPLSRLIASDFEDIVNCIER